MITSRIIPKEIPGDFTKIDECQLDKVPEDPRIVLL